MEEMQSAIREGKKMLQHMEKTYFTSLEPKMETARFPVLPEDRNRFLSPIAAESAAENHVVTLHM